jgi:hypothetical protein
MGIAWAHVDPARRYKAAIDALTDMINALPKPPKPDQKYSEEAQAAAVWAGRLREYAEHGSDVRDNRLPAAFAALDAAVRGHSAEIMALYQDGRNRVRDKLKEFDDKIDKADEADKVRLNIDRRQLIHYASFPYDDIVQRILAGLNE